MLWRWSEFECSRLLVPPTPMVYAYNLNFCSEPAVVRCFVSPSLKISSTFFFKFLPLHLLVAPLSMGTPLKLSKRLLSRVSRFFYLKASITLFLMLECIPYFKAYSSLSTRALCSWFIIGVDRLLGTKKLKVGRLRMFPKVTAFVIFWLIKFRQQEARRPIGRCENGSWLFLSSLGLDHGRH